MWLWSNVELSRSRNVRGGDVVTAFARSRYWSHAADDLADRLSLFLTDQDGPIAGVVGGDDFRRLVSAATRLQRRQARVRRAAQRWRSRKIA